MDAERDRRACRVRPAPSSRTLILRFIACVVACAIGWFGVAPETVRAAEHAAQTVEAQHALDLLSVSCESDRPRPQLPEIRTLLAQAGRRSVVLGNQIAQAEPTPTAAPTQIGPPPGDAGGTPLPGVSPTPGQLQRPPIGPGLLIPATPPGQTPAPTAPPLPTATPSATPRSGPVPIAPITAGPAPTVNPAGGTPTPFSSATPAPAESLAPLGANQVAILADKYSGSTKDNQPQDFSGNVNMFYSDGVIVADRAHYDGVRYFDFTGNAYIRNYKGDTVLRGDIIRFDRETQRATLLNGAGDTTQGVEKGKLHFSARDLVAQKNGHTVGTNASWTTCENQRGGYHVESKTFDLMPNDKLVARKVTVYLGALAIFYLPLLVIGLRQDRGPPKTSFLPLFGYSQTEGFFVKFRFGFGPSPYYNGYYRVEYFTRLGLGLGYTAFIGTRTGRRNANVDFYRSPPRGSTGNNNFSATEQEQWSSKVRSQFQTQYVSSYGPGFTNQPPSLTLGGTVSYTGSNSTETLTFQRYTQGTQQGALNLGYTETLKLRQNLTEALNVGYNRNYNSLAGVSAAVGSTHLQSMLNYTTNWALYTMNFDKTISASPSGKQVFPEIQIQPRTLFPFQKAVPLSAQFTLGEYTETTTPFSTARGEASLNFGPLVANVLGSQFNASLRVRQDAYATGDLKAQIDQQASLTTPIGNHFLNSITYSETNSNGPQAIPFSTFDLLSGASHSAQDVFQVYNRDVYVLRLSTGTAFNRQGQPLAYSLTVRPSYRSFVSFDGSYNPGPGNGFAQTQARLVTPFGFMSDLQFATTIDWKNKGRMISKTLFYRKVIGNCYDIRLSYNQDLKLVTLGFDLLAFPSRGVNFGLGTTGSIVPGNLTGSF